MLGDEREAEKRTRGAVVASLPNGGCDQPYERRRAAGFGGRRGSGARAGEHDKDRARALCLLSLAAREGTRGDRVGIGRSVVRARFRRWGG